MPVERLCVVRWPSWSIGVGVEAGPSSEPPAGASLRAFEPYVRAVAEMVPLVEVGEPGQLCFATRGPSRYFGGDEAMVERLTAVLAGVQPGARSDNDPVAAAVRTGPWGVGVAEGRLAATLAALHSVRAERPVIVPPGATPSFLAPFPVRVLCSAAGVAAEVVERLDRLGLRRLGDVAAMASSDLLARFGSAGQRAHLLAGGGDDSFLQPGVPAAAPEVAAHLDTPLPQLDAVVFVARQLADQLVTDLATRGQVCTLMRVQVETEHGERSERCWSHADGLSAPAMIERIRWQLHGWVGGGEHGWVGGGEHGWVGGGEHGWVGGGEHGWVGGGEHGEHGEHVTAGVVLVRLVAEHVRADLGRQAGLWGGQSEADEWAVRAVARVVGLLGPHAVAVPEWRGGRDPWQRYCWVPTAAVDPSTRRERVRPVARPWPGSLPAPSPARVLVSPVAVEVLDASGRLVQVSGRGELSATPVQLVMPGRPPRQVTGWAGPWPIEERWWDPRRHHRRARLQLLTDDGDATLVVVEQGRWWVRAVYA